MYSINRILIAFFLSGIVWLTIVPFVEVLLDSRIRTNIMFFYAEYIMLFIPKIIYATSIEFLQKYIKEYSLFGLIGTILIYINLFIYDYYFFPSTLKMTYLISICISSFFISLYLKYLYNKANSKSDFRHI